MINEMFGVYNGEHRRDKRELNGRKRVLEIKPIKNEDYERAENR